MLETTKNEMTETTKSECSLPCSQGPATGLRPKPDESNPHYKKFFQVPGSV